MGGRDGHARPMPRSDPLDASDRRGAAPSRRGREHRSNTWRDALLPPVEDRLLSSRTAPRGDRRRGGEVLGRWRRRETSPPTRSRRHTPRIAPDVAGSPLRARHLDDPGDSRPLRSARGHSTRRPHADKARALPMHRLTLDRIEDSARPVSAAISRYDDPYRNTCTSRLRQVSSKRAKIRSTSSLDPGFAGGTTAIVSEAI